MKIDKNWSKLTNLAKKCQNCRKSTKIDQNRPKLVKMGGFLWVIWGLGGVPPDPPRDPPYLRALLEKKKNFCAVYRYLYLDLLLTKPNGLKKRHFPVFRGFCSFLDGGYTSGGIPGQGGSRGGSSGGGPRGSNLSKNGGFGQKSQKIAKITQIFENFTKIY